MPFTPSPQQAGYFDWIENGKGNLILEAVAGAGKTTTLLEGTRRMQGSIVMLAYGNAAAKDMQAKAAEKGCNRPDLRISTVHSACFGAWRYAAQGVQVDDAKVLNILNQIQDAGGEQGAVVETARATIRKLVSLGKAFLMGVPDASNPQLTRQRDVRNFAVWGKLAERYSLFDDLPENYDTSKVLALTADVFERSAQMCRTLIDYDDMIYAPIRFRARFFKNDWVLGDEWQDANPARREAVRRMLKPTGRAVFVGDRHQDIFGFTGTGNDSLGRTKAEFNCAEMPLTVTYRCPKNVVQHLHQWVGHIQAHDNAPDGLVSEVAFDAALKDAKGKTVPWYLQNRPEKTDAILCRYNKPLVETAFGLLRAGVACQVEGRDIGKNLTTLAQRWKVRDLGALEGKLATYLQKEVDKARAAQNERKEQDIRDRVETLGVFIESCRSKGKHTVSDLVAEIEALFADGVKNVTTLCSGHKSKGREWGRVYWIQHTVRTKRPLQPWENEQENNINYVIASRVEGVHGAGELWLVPENVHKAAA